MNHSGRLVEIFDKRNQQPRVNKKLSAKQIMRALEVQYKTPEEQMAIATQLTRDVSDVAAENRHAIVKIENQKVKPDFEFSKLCELLRSFKFKFYAFTTGLDVESEYDSNDPDDDGLDVESEYDSSDPDDDGYLSSLAGDND